MTPWIDAINKLRSLKYEITGKEGGLKYVYHGKDFPSADQITPH
jgi:hypothetical protein